MDDGERRKKKKKSKKKDIEMDVDKTVARAMKQVEQAMKQVDMVTKSRHRVPPHEYTEPGAGGGFGTDEYGNPRTAQYVKLETNTNTTIHVSNSKNVQVGNNNLMIINETRTRKKNIKSKDDTDEDSDDGDKAGGVSEVSVSQQYMAILESGREITEKDISIAAKYIGKSWRRFARSLELSDREAEELYQDHNDTGVREVAYQCIKLWKQRNGPNATVGKLAHAVKRVDPSMYCLKELSYTV